MKDKVQRFSGKECCGERAEVFCGGLLAPWAEQPEKTSGDLEETKEGSARELMWLCTRSHWGMDRETVILVSCDAFGKIRNC